MIDDIIITIEHWTFPDLLEDWDLMWHMVDHITVGKEHDGGVGGQEDKDVPDPMQVGEPNTSPVGAEEPE